MWTRDPGTGYWYDRGYTVYIVGFGGVGNDTGRDHYVAYSYATHQPIRRGTLAECMGS